MNITITRTKTITFTDADIILLEKIMGYAKHRTSGEHRGSGSGLYACTSEQERETIKMWQQQIISFK